MTTLPQHRRILDGRTYSQPWNPADSDPLTLYPRVESRFVTVGYAVVCIAASVFVGWLLAQGV